MKIHPFSHFFHRAFSLLPGLGLMVGLSLHSPALGMHPIQPFKVVIDPGHGGEDLGTVYDNGTTRITEKEITLLLAREVARQLKARKISVTLTRQWDKEVPLGDRTALANRIRADLFLSIHMNSAPHPSAASEAEGIETFILNNTTDESSRRLARLENTVLGRRKEDNPDVALILRDLTLDANLAESKRLACTVQNNLIFKTSNRQRAIKDRGVKQALFHVLLGAEMPSALVEAGFLSHARDRKFITSPEGRKQVGAAIARAIDQFRRHKGTPFARSTLSNCKVH